MITAQALNKQYQAYLDDPLQVESFGEAVLEFITQTIRYQCRGKADQMSESVDDAIGDVVLRVWENIEHFDSKQSAFSTFVNNVIANYLIDTFRKRKNRQEIELTPDIPAPTVGKPDINLALQKIIGQLGEKDKSFVYAYLEGLSEQELGDRFNRNARWAKNKLFRLKEKMRLLAHPNV